MLSYLLGACLLAVMVVPTGWAATRVTHRLLPDWSGAPALVVATVFALVQLVLVSEILGAFGLFRRFVVAGALAAVAVAMGLGAGRRGRARPTPPPRPNRIEVYVAAAIASLLMVPWVAWTWASARTGPWSFDSLVYHLPFAAQWVQTGSLWHVNRLMPDTVIAYNPATTEIVHALGMLAFHNALLTPFVNLAWLGLAAVAAWSIGARWNRGPQCLALGLTIANCPLLFTSQPGSAMTDLPLIALVLAAVAIMVQSESTPRLAVPIGLALGLVAGTKLDGLAFVAVVGLGYPFLVARGDRLVSGVRLLGAALLAGGFFYLRNLAAAGNPLPGLQTVFPRVKAPVEDNLAATILHYLGNPTVLRRYMYPALHVAFGALWPLSILLIVGGTVSAILWARDRIHRLAALGAAATVVAWVVTPTSAGGPPGQPTLFLYNMRYAVAGFVLGAVLLATVPKFTSRVWGWAWLAIAGLVSVASVAARGSWPDVAGYSSSIGWKQMGAVVVVPAAVLVGGAVIWLRRHPGHARNVGWGAGLVVLAGLFAGGYQIAHRDVPGWYTQPTSRFAPALAWSTRLHHQRIGAVELAFTFPLYNDDLSNRVTAVGTSLPDHEFTAPSSCRALRTDVNAGRYQYVVFSPDYVGQPLAPEQQWLANTPGATKVFQSGDDAVYRIDGPLRLEGCAS